MLERQRIQCGAKTFPLQSFCLQSIPYNQSGTAMPTYCDVALPVPLDMAFTYKIAELQPVVGGRVLVPFRNQRISGVVTALHDREPSMQAKTLIEVLDTEPVLDEGLNNLVTKM